MLTLFVIGIFVLTIKMMQICVKAAWGIAKGIFCALILPVALTVMVMVGLIKLAVPLLLIALVLAFVLPALKKTEDDETVVEE